MPSQENSDFTGVDFKIKTLMLEDKVALPPLLFVPIFQASNPTLLFQASLSTFIFQATVPTLLFQAFVPTLLFQASIPGS